MQNREQYIVKVAGQKWDRRFYYAPNSILHGTLKGAYGGPGIKNETLLRQEVGRMTDFIDFLFNHSEHCDHISESDAWKEFEIYESKTSMIADRVREYRKTLK